MPNEPIEGNQGSAGGTGANPTPSAQPGQPSAVDYAKSIQELQAKLNAQDAVLRALQSGKDKRWDTEVKPLQETVDRLAEALGVDANQVKAAQHKLALEDLAEAYIEESEAEPSSIGMGDGEENSAELGTIEAALELPANDPRVADLRLRFGNDVATFALAAAKFKQSLATAPSTPAEQPPPGGSPSRPGPETDAQKRARIFGPPTKGIFDEDSIRSQGGGAFVSGRYVPKT